MSKSAPYARPGEDVTLRMLWEDGAEVPPRDAETFFAYWCVNPPADQFSACLSQFNQQPEITLGSNQTTITVPDDALQPQSSGSDYPAYGVIYVFYGVCAGRLAFLGKEVGAGGAGGAGAGNLPDFGADVESSQFLPACHGEDGEELGPDDYLLGYSAIYVYDEFRNAAPKINGFQVAGKDVQVDCVDDACDGPFAEPSLTSCEPGVACFETCPGDGDATCPETDLGPLIDPSSVEKDEIALVAYGTDIEEALWVSYFVDRGQVSSPVKLVNDATTGMNPLYQTKFRAPKEPGPLRIWAAVRDNRGGIAWIRVPGYVRETSGGGSR